MFQALKQFLAHQKTFFQGKALLGVLVLFGVFFFLGGGEVFALDDTTSVQRAFAEIIVLVVHFIIYLSWLVLGLIGPLFSNELIMHPNVVPMLHLLWTVIRNLVNIIFVGVLLYVAAKVIFDFGSDGLGDFKGNLIKIAAALVLVNFSFLAVKVLVDVSTVATHASFSLAQLFPQGASQNLTGASEGGEKKMTQVYSITYNDAPGTKKLPTSASKDTDEVCANAEDATQCKDSVKKYKQLSLRNMIFVSPYGGGQSGELSPFSAGAMSIPETAEGGQLSSADTAITEKFRKKNHIPEADNYPCWDESASQPRNCNSLNEFLQQQKDRALIHIVVKDNVNVSEIGNNTLVPMMVQNLIPLEEFILNDSENIGLGTLLLKILFSFIVSLLLLLAFILMFVVLLVRAAVLWLAFIASPLMVFGFLDVLGDLQSKVKDGIQHVIRFAFIPAMFGIVLSLAFIVIGQLGYSSSTFTQSGTVVLTESALGGTHPLFNLLIMALVIVLLWWGVFWALQNPITEGMVNFVKDNVESGAKWLAKRPLHINFIPIASGGVQGKMDINTGFKNLTSALKEIGGEGDVDDKQAQDILGGKYKLKSDAAKKVNEYVEKTDIKKIIPSHYEKLKTALEQGDNGKKNFQEPLNLILKEAAKEKGVAVNELSSDEQKSVLSAAIGKMRENGVSVSSMFSGPQLLEELKKVTGKVPDLMTGLPTALEEAVTKGMRELSDLSDTKQENLNKALKAIGIQEVKNKAFFHTHFSGKSYQKIMDILEGLRSNDTFEFDGSEFKKKDLKKSAETRS